MSQSARFCEQLPLKQEADGSAVCNSAGAPPPSVSPRSRTLLSGICSSVFSTIINQAPFAIDDLMKEVRASEDSDSGQASEGDEEEEGNEKMMKMEAGRKQLNGKRAEEKQEVQTCVWC